MTVDPNFTLSSTPVTPPMMKLYSAIAQDSKQRQSAERFQSMTPRSSKPKFYAQWVEEDGELVCRWFED